MHPFEIVRIELLGEARLGLIAASFLRSRWPSVSDKFIDLAVQALALRAHWEAARAEDIRDTSHNASPRRMELG
jgi:hypothetical protein